MDKHKKIVVVVYGGRVVEVLSDSEEVDVLVVNKDDEGEGLVNFCDASGESFKASCKTARVVSKSESGRYWRQFMEKKFGIKR